MGLYRKSTTNILTACVALSLFILLWRTFGVAERAGHAGLYHSSSSFLAKTHLQSRHAKPQTLPYSKVAYPLPNRAPHVAIRSKVQALLPDPRVAPVAIPSTPEVQAQAESSPIVEREIDVVTTVAADQPQARSDTPSEVQTGMVPRDATKMVSCSQDMSLPCLLKRPP